MSLRPSPVTAAIAAVAASFGPWPGPHIDHYLPLAVVAAHAEVDGVSGPFWMWLAALWCGYGVVGLGVLMVVKTALKRWIK